MPVSTRKRPESKPRLPHRHAHCSAATKSTLCWRQAEATSATLEEAAAHGDMILVDGGTGTDYRSIVYKTFALVQWVVANRQPKFILKTDDDAYVHTANLVDALRAVRPLLAPLLLSVCLQRRGSWV